jgi:hypothetical protein
LKRVESGQGDVPRCWEGKNSFAELGEGSENTRGDSGRQPCYVESTPGCVGATAWQATELRFDNQRSDVTIPNNDSDGGVRDEASSPTLHLQNPEPQMKSPGSHKAATSASCTKERPRTACGCRRESFAGRAVRLICRPRPEGRAAPSSRLVPVGRASWGTPLTKREHGLAYLGGRRRWFSTEWARFSRKLLQSR